MGAFTLDTSGAVYQKTLHGEINPLIGTIWPDLDPFTQGYVEAQKQAFPLVAAASGETSEDVIDWRFSDLAPETLAAILKDCAARLAERSRLGSEKDGRDFWCARQRGTWEATYPPLTPYLGDDGKIYLRDAA